MTTPKRLVDEVSNVSSGSKKSKPIIRSSPSPKKTYIGKDLKNSAVIQPKAKQKISVFKKPSSIKSPTKRDVEAESSAPSKKFIPTSKIDLETDKKQNKNLDVELEDSPEYQVEVQEPVKVKVELDSSPESGNKQESEIKE